MPTRRAILAACLAASIPGRALADPPGRITTEGLADLLDGLARVDDGDPAKPRIRIVFSPLCHRGLDMFKATQARRMDASWAWIPYGAGNAAQRRACQAALDDGTASGLEAVLGGTGPEVADRQMAAQDRIISVKAGRIFWDATQTAMGTPSSVYRRRDGIYMAVRGALDAAGVERMLDAAG